MAERILMASATALFARHWKQFGALIGQRVPESNEFAIIYAACILAEAIRNEQDETDVTIRPTLEVS